MGEVERDRDAGHAVRAEPLVGQPEVRPELEAAGLQLAVQLGDALFEVGALDREVEVAQAQVEQALVVPFGPFTGRYLAGRIHRAILVVPCRPPRTAEIRPTGGPHTPRRLCPGRRQQQDLRQEFLILPPSS